MYLLKHQKVWDFAGVHSAKPAIKADPSSYEELSDVIKQHPYKISIAGSKYSHGGQTMADDCLYLDMCNLNRILSFDDKTITVQSGCTWRSILEELDKHDLSVAEMQSYANFSVGGSISVNCHGRGMKYGTIADTIVKLKVLCLDKKGNRILWTYPDEPLFKAVVGGYGGIAIILEATLLVCPNEKLEKIVQICKTSDVNTALQIDKPIVFYNGNIFPKRDNEVVNIYYVSTDKPVTVQERLQPQKQYYWATMFMEQLLRRTGTLKYLRAYFSPELSDSDVCWRNWEMSYDTNTLNTLTKFPTTSVLQEYFVPVTSICGFLRYFWSVMHQYQVNIINVSLRYVKATSIPILNYCLSSGSTKDMIAIVIYVNIGNNPISLGVAQYWTRLLIDAALSVGGTYYLPYLPFATKEQFRKAYPNWKQYREIKQQYDPENRLTSHFIEKYII